MIFLYFFSDSKNQINRQQDHQNEHQICRKGMKQGLVMTMIHMRSVLIQKYGHKKKRKEKLQISVHITSQEDIRPYLTEKQGLLIEQEEEQEWFIRCPVS